MGIDATLVVRGNVPDDELEAGLAFFADRWQETPPQRSGWSGCIEIDMDGERYYGPGYERGNWPKIANAIMHARAAFPKRVIAYGGDSDDPDDFPEATDDLLAEYWKLWNAYHQQVAS